MVPLSSGGYLQQNGSIISMETILLQKKISQNNSKVLRLIFFDNLIQSLFSSFKNIVREYEVKINERKELKTVNSSLSFS